MFLEAVLLGLLVGWLRGGRSLNIGSFEFKGWVLIVIGFLLQMLPMLLGRMNWMAHNGHLIGFATMVLVFIIVVWNIDKHGFWLVTLGAALNLVAMMFHGLRMPVYLTGLQKAGHLELLDSIKNNAALNYTGVEHLTRWSDYLGKVIALPDFYPLAQVVTVGDLLMSVGLFLFIVGQMTSNQHFRNKGRMVNTFYPTKY